jgi:mRNA interferase RelE/StbE
VRIEWSPAACTAARRFIADQDGLREVGAAVSALVDDPDPPDAFVRGKYRRLKVGPYRVMYVLEDDLITVERVDLAI